MASLTRGAMASLTRGHDGRPEASLTPPPKLIDLMIDAAARHLLGQRRGRRPLVRGTRGRHDSRVGVRPAASLPGPWRRPAGSRRVASGCAVSSKRTAGWAIHPDGPTDPSASVKAYLCLKLAGDDPQSPRMAGARRAILRAGGLRACNSYTKLYLSIFGLWTWRRSPAVPPEIILLPRWFYFNLHEMSSWTRTIVVPLSVIWALKPSVRLDVTLDELEGDSGPGRRRTTLYESFWSAVFVGVNGLIKLVEVVGPAPRWRRRALEKAEEWLVAHLEGSDGLGAIFPAMVNAVIALRCLGYAESDPLVQGQLRGTRTVRDRRGRGAAASALLLAGVGYGTVGGAPCSRRAWTGTGRPFRKRWPGCSNARSRLSATGGRRVSRTPREAGASSIETISIPTATTRRKSCWCWPRSGGGPTSWKRAGRPRRREGSAGSSVCRTRTEAGPRSTAAATGRCSP